METWGRSWTPGRAGLRPRPWWPDLCCWACRR